MDIKIFNVEHGACALLTCDDNTRLMIDCGHNSTTGWYPGSYLRNQGVSLLDMLAITNYDEDHVSGIADLFDNIEVRWLLRNRDVSSSSIRQLKSDDGMGPGIARLVDAIDNVFTGDGTAPKPSFAGLTRKVFYNSPQVFNDENNLSAVLHLECNGTGILFPGDLERAGWLELIKKEDFCAALRNTKILVASHHGRESGCCEEIFNYMSPHYVVISDQGYQFDTQETAGFYYRHSKGGPFRNESSGRHVLTTRNDGLIGFSLRTDGWGPY